MSLSPLKTQWNVISFCHGHSRVALPCIFFCAQVDENSLLGEGSFGKVYRATLKDEYERTCSGYKRIPTVSGNKTQYALKCIRISDVSQANDGILETLRLVVHRMHAHMHACTCACICTRARQTVNHRNVVKATTQFFHSCSDEQNILQSLYVLTHCCAMHL